ncbi:RNA-binding ATPase activator esf2 [Mortierella antarctica]|nr:RNA-binding ATPase activator esf2 [Mortierella antarctica]
MASKVKTDDIFNLSEGDDGHSDSDASGYDSDDAPRKKVVKKSAKAAPKKKNAVVFGLDDQDNSDDDDDYSSQEEQENDDGDDDQDAPVSSDPRFHLNKPSSSSSETKEQDGEKRQRVRPKTKKQKLESLTPEALEKFQKAREKTGIVYLSKIPPFMKPIKLRHLLGQFGELGRVYLAPEDAKVAARRKKYGGNKKQNYTEGWVEFKDKSIAKQVANSLNTTVIGGKKNSHYHDDMWNIKYLPKFKWHHLTERIAYENASRAQRLQAEISQAKRENKFILNNIEKSKMIKSMEEKKEAKRKADVPEGNSESTKKAKKAASSSTSSAPTSAPSGATSDAAMKGIRRAFKQRKLGGEESSKPVGGKIKSVLGSVFGR